MPYRKKSYHSIVVPIVLATTAFRRWDLTSGSGAVIAGRVIPASKG